jgi:hypothetical protein
MAENKTLRQIARSFVVDGPSGVSIRDRLKGLTPEDEEVLRLVGARMGRLASGDLARCCRDGLEHSTGTWAERKRDLTAECSSRWAGSVTSGTHDQWGLSRRAQWRHLRSLDAGIRTVRHRLSLPVGEKGGKGRPGGYRSRREWFLKSRRLAILEASTRTSVPNTRPGASRSCAAARSYSSSATTWMPRTRPRPGGAPNGRPRAGS